MPQRPFKKLQRELEKIAPEVSQAAARETVRVIRSRTRKNQDVEGNAFVALRPDYAKRVGRKSFIGGSLTRDLRIEKAKEGHIVRLRGGTTSRGKPIVDVARIIQRGAPNRTTSAGTPNKLAPRRWFGVSDSQRKKMRRDFQIRLQRVPGDRYIITVGGK